MTASRGALALLVTLLAGCGLKGPLYLPVPVPEATVEPEADDAPAETETPESDDDG